MDNDEYGLSKLELTLNKFAQKCSNQGRELVLLQR
jgi:hypothetical protein